jgi:glycosyltransferase involved in cell wall biosynthesis
MLGEVEKSMTMPDRPILSIIIPTKNREQYIGPCIRSLMKTLATDVEVVVQDNSDNGQTVLAMSPFNGDPRLRYNHCTDQLSMSDNFTKGLEAASGEYISFIGDDDGVNPGVVDAVRWAKEQGLDALVGCSAASYQWPDIISKTYGKLLSATLTIKPFSGKVSYPDVETQLYLCARMAGYTFGMLPVAYYGAVKRELMDQIFQKAGTYFPGPTPDMASAVALACVIKRYAYIDYPLFVPGHGRGSGGGAGSEKKHDWSLEAVPWFSRRAINCWSDFVPRFCCGTTLWAEDVIQALQAMGREDVLQHFNTVFMYARCAVFNRHHNPQTLASLSQFVHSRRLSKPRTLLAFNYYYLLTWSERLSALASNALILARLSKTIQIRNVADIDQAIDTLTLFLCTHNRHFDEGLS